MDDNFVYELDGAVYINLTNRCSNDCRFCLRRTQDGVGSANSLWLSREPSAFEVIELLQALPLGDFKEAVFCGYGEPTYRLVELVDVAKFCKSQGMRTRLNTNGQGSLINNRDIAPELCAVIDTISISLNASNPQKYQAECSSVFGEAAHSALLDFAVRCRTSGAHVVLSVVDCIGADEVTACRALAEGLGLDFRARRLY